MLTLTFWTEPSLPQVFCVHLGEPKNLAQPFWSKCVCQDGRDTLTTWLRLPPEAGFEHWLPRTSLAPPLRPWKFERDVRGDLELELVLALCLFVEHPWRFDATIVRLLPLRRENGQECLTHSVRGWHAWSQLVEACNDIREVLTQLRH